MATQWMHRINVIIPQADREAINALWSVIAPGGDAEYNTFGAPLSSDRQEPATHQGISTAATEEMRLLIIDTFADELSSAVTSIQPYTENDWDAFIASNGLQLLEVEL